MSATHQEIMNKVYELSSDSLQSIAVTLLDCEREISRLQDDVERLNKALDDAEAQV